MALKVYELHEPDDGEHWSSGVAIIDTATGEPLRIPRDEFADTEDSVVEARALAAWLTWQGGSWLDEPHILTDNVRLWHRIRGWRKCAGSQCEFRLAPSRISTLCDGCADEAVA